MCCLHQATNKPIITEILVVNYSILPALPVEQGSVTFNAAAIATAASAAFPALLENINSNL